jgi:antitoxin MazE
METGIQTKIIKIGNSQGIRIPKLLSEQTSLGEEAELAVKENAIIIRSVLPARYGWEAQFKEMAEHGDDQLLDDDLLPTSSNRQPPFLCTHLPKK